MKEKTEDTSIVTQHTKGKEAMFMPKYASEKVKYIDKSYL